MHCHIYNIFVKKKIYKRFPPRSAALEIQMARTSLQLLSAENVKEDHGRILGILASSRRSDEKKEVTKRVCVTSSRKLYWRHCIAYYEQQTAQKLQHDSVVHFGVERQWCMRTTIKTTVRVKRGKKKKKKQREGAGSKKKKERKTCYMARDH